MLDESGVANGVYGYKQDSVHVAWVGGIAYREYQDDGVIRTDRTKLVSVDNRTDAQKVALFDLLRDTVYRSSVDSVRVPYPVEKKLTRWQQACIDYGKVMMGATVLLVLFIIAWIARRLRNSS